MRTGERIRKLRLQRGMTQQELATALGCSRPTVVTWETGLRQTPIHQLRRVAKILQAPLSEMLGEGHKAEAVIDFEEKLLVEMYRLLPRRLQQKHLELFTASVEIREAGKLKGDAPDTLSVPVVRNIIQRPR